MSNQNLSQFSARWQVGNLQSEELAGELSACGFDELAVRMDGHFTTKASNNLYILEYTQKEGPFSSS
ncbi:hypothetical protein Gotur_022640 [Gossypium turneri]